MASPPRVSKVGKGEGRSIEEQSMHEAMQATDSGWKSPDSGAPLMARPGNPRAISMHSGHEYELVGGALKRSEGEADEAANSATAPEGMEEEITPPRKSGGPRDQHRGFQCAVTKQPITGVRFTTRHNEIVQNAGVDAHAQHDVCQAVFEAMPSEQQHRPWWQQQLDTSWCFRKTLLRRCVGGSPPWRPRSRCGRCRRVAQCRVRWRCCRRRGGRGRALVAQCRVRWRRCRRRGGRGRALARCPRAPRRRRSTRRGRTEP